MLSIERKINVNKMFSEKNGLNPKTSSYFNIKKKLFGVKEFIDDSGSEFENQIKKIFQRNKFNINNQYDHSGVKSFLIEKDECLKKMELNDSILYKNLNMSKKIKNQKNNYKIHKIIKSIDIKEKIKIETNNKKVIDSFLSNKSGGSIEEILELLK